MFVFRDISAQCCFETGDRASGALVVHIYVRTLNAAVDIWDCYEGTP